MTTLGYDQIDLSPKTYKAGWITAYENSRETSLWSDAPTQPLVDYVSQFHAESVTKVLEAGCGDGRNTAYMLSNGFSVTGIDLSSAALARCYDRVSQQSLVNYCLLQADIENLPDPISPTMFDAVVCLDTIGQILRIEDAVRGLREVTKEHGLLLLNLYTPNDAAFGEGRRLGEQTFLYRNTIFRFFTESDIQTIFARFEILDIKLQRWEDPPHGSYRPKSHVHESYVVLLRKTAI